MDPIRTVAIDFFNMASLEGNTSNHADWGQFRTFQTGILRCCETFSHPRVACSINWYPSPQTETGLTK